jgi:hypothetical protein
VWNRASTWNLVLSLVAFVFFMNVVAMVMGFGMGLAELVLWLGVLVAGVVLIVRRYANARATAGRPGST